MEKTIIYITQHITDNRLFETGHKKLILFSKSDTLSNNTKLRLNELYTFESTKIEISNLIDYVKSNFYSFNNNQILVVTPSSIYQPKIYNSQVVFTRINSLELHHLYFLKRTWNYYLYLKIPKNNYSLNDIISKSLVRIIRDNLKIEIDGSIFSKIRTQLSPEHIEIILELITHQVNIFQYTSKNNDRDYFCQSLFDTIQNYNSPVVQLLLSAYLFRNSDLIEDSKILNLIFTIELTSDDIFFFEFLGSLNFLLMKKYNKKDIIFASFDIVLYNVLYDLSTSSSSDKNELSILFEALITITELTSSNKQLKAKIYHFYSIFISNSFNIDKIRYYLRKSYTTWLDVIETSNFQNNENALSAIYNFVKIEKNIENKQKLTIKNYFRKYFSTHKCKYSELYFICSVNNILDLELDQLIQSKDQRLVDNISKIYTALDFTIEDKTSYDNFLSCFNQIQNLLIAKDYDLALIADYLFILHKDGLGYAKQIFEMSRNFYKIEELIELTRENFIKLNENDKHLKHLVLPMFELHLFNYLISNLKDLEKYKVFEILTIIESFDNISTDIITPKSLVISLIKFYFENTILSPSEMVYLEATGILLENSPNNIRPILEVIEEFSIYIKNIGSLEAPQLSPDRTGLIVKFNQ